MSTRLSETLGVVLAAVLVFAGCEQSQKQSEEDVATGLAPETVTVPSGFTSDVFEAAGGLEAWKQTRKLQFDGVVTLYEPDGSFYLTEQHYDVYPWLGAIDVSGRESGGEYVWRLSGGQFSEPHGATVGPKLPSNLERSCLADAILAIATAPVRLLDTSGQLDRQETAIRIQGRWYFPINKTGGRTGASVFYQGRDSLLVDMIRVDCAGPAKSVVVRGYDYQQIERQGPVVPRKIEIFEAGAEGTLQKRLAQIDCYRTMQAK
ncbi:MAG: hypothetical protein P8Z79_10825 [Sedimentisphaerales bacterium]|jgi:hypothetical protein